jgi:hypothetical protein
MMVVTQIETEILMMLLVLMLARLTQVLLLMM